MNAGQNVTAAFGPDSLKGRGFANCYAEVMQAVEDCATYLDGPGRAAARAMSRDEQAAYSAAALRLTTGFMNLASVSLILRSLSDGSVSPEQCRRDLSKVVELSPDTRGDRNSPRLPQEIRTLAGSCSDLKARMHLYARSVVGGDGPRPAGSPVMNLVADLAQRIGASLSR